MKLTLNSHTHTHTCTHTDQVNAHFTAIHEVKPHKSTEKHTTGFTLNSKLAFVIRHSIQAKTHRTSHLSTTANGLSTNIIYHALFLCLLFYFILLFYLLFNNIVLLYFHPVVSSSSFFSSPNLSSRRLDVYRTSTHGVALV